MNNVKLQSEVIEALQNHGIEEATPAEKKLLSAIKSGAHVAAHVPESLRTHALLAALVVHKLKHSYEDVARALFIVRTKEEVLALEETFEWMGKHTDLRVWTAFEGPDILKQKDNIYFGADVVIGTATRLNALLGIEGLNSAGMKIMIVPEGYSSISTQHKALIHRISDSLPPCQKVICYNKQSDRIDRYVDEFMYPCKTLKLA